MSQRNVDIVRRGYELFAAGDLEALMGLISPDAELADAGGLGVTGTAAGTRRGPEGFLRATEEVLESFEDYRVQPEDFIGVGDAVIVPVQISGRGRASGAELDVRLAHLWVLRDGKAVLSEIYRTVPEALVGAAFDAFHRGGVDSLVGLLAPDVEWNVRRDLPDAAVYRGHDGVRRLVARFDEVVEGMWIRPRELILAGEHQVVAPLTWGGRGKGSGLDFEERRETWLITVRAGAIVRVDEFATLEDALSAAER